MMEYEFIGDGWKTALAIGVPLPYTVAVLWGINHMRTRSPVDVNGFAIFHSVTTISSLPLFPFDLPLTFLSLFPSFPREGHALHCVVDHVCWIGSGCSTEGNAKGSVCIVL